MNTPLVTRPATQTGAGQRPSSAQRAIIRHALIVGLPLLALAACSSPRPGGSLKKASSTGSSATAPSQPETCAPAQLAFSLDAGEGRFNGMSHSGTMLVLRNAGSKTCTVPARPLVTLNDAGRQTLDIVARDPTGAPTPSIPVTLAPGATVTSDMRWVSNDVYDDGHCETPAHITLAIGDETISTSFAGHLCGAGGQSSSYTLTSFQPATAPQSATVAKAMTYTCDDRRTLEVTYPDHDTAVLTFDGDVHRLHIAISASGARYVGDRWQWWTKGMHEGWLAPLKPGETIASARGVSCTAP